MLVKIDENANNEIEEIGRIRSWKRLVEIYSLDVKKIKGSFNIMFKKGHKHQ